MSILAIKLFTPCHSMMDRPTSSSQETNSITLLLNEAVSMHDFALLILMKYCISLSIVRPKWPLQIMN